MFKQNPSKLSLAGIGDPTKPDHINVDFLRDCDKTLAAEGFARPWPGHMRIWDGQPIYKPSIESLGTELDCHGYTRYKIGIYGVDERELRRRGGHGIAAVDLGPWTPGRILALRYQPHGRRGTALVGDASVPTTGGGGGVPGESGGEGGGPEDGNGPTSSPPTIDGVNVLYMQTGGSYTPGTSDIIDALIAAGATVDVLPEDAGTATGYEDFSTIDLSGYGIIYCGTGGYASLDSDANNVVSAANETALRAWVTAGGFLIVENGGDTGTGAGDANRYSWQPHDTGWTISSPDTAPNAVVDFPAVHTINDGLTAATIATEIEAGAAYACATAIPTGLTAAIECAPDNSNALTVGAATSTLVCYGTLGSGKVVYSFLAVDTNGGHSEATQAIVNAALWFYEA